jgi:integrase
MDATQETHVMLLRELLDKEYVIVRGLRPKAAYQVRLTLSRWSDFLGRGPTTADLLNLRVMEFLHYRKSKVSLGTVLKDRNGICGLWNYAAKQDRTLPFPTLPPMSPIKRAPRAYTIEDISKVIRVAKALPGDVMGVQRGLWWATIFRTAFETAERHGALAALRWSEVDLPGRLITFLAEGRKGGGQDIQREISGELASWLDEMRREPGELVWPWKGVESSQWQELGRICTLAQVTNRGFHGFRKSNASYLTAARGVGAASEQLGHSSSSVTLRHYVDRSIAKPKETAIDLLPPLNLGE